MSAKRNIERIVRVSVLILLTWLAYRHDKAEQYWLLFGDFVVFVLIALNWAMPFIKARQSKPKT